MSIQSNTNIRNIAIIAHVDHGKTTLIDQLFRQSGLFREGARLEDRIMDNMDLEKERGITISAKNCSIIYNDVRINILDTPGHADFGGEVERALMMVDGVILLVDAAEGPLPQTRFVLQKALQQDLGVAVCLNKIDRSDARPEEVLNEIYDLFIDLDADEDQLDFPILYTVGRDGIAKKELASESDNLKDLFDLIVDKLPAPKYDPEEPFQMLVANLDYSEYLGRLAIGKVINGSIRAREDLARINKKGDAVPLKVAKLQSYDGVGLAVREQVLPGDIVVLAGQDEVEIGDTICNREHPKALPRITVDEPTVEMHFYPNNSPFTGTEGKFIHPQKIGERLIRETLFNVAVQVEKNPDETFTVKGRGEFQLAILIETMRREGFEFMAGRPQVLFKDINGKKHEPIEHLVIDCGDAYSGTVTEKLSRKKGRMVNMVNHGYGRVRLEFSVPSRALISFRNEFLTDTKGTGIMSSYLDGYEEYRGDFPARTSGSLVSDREGKAIPFALANLEARGTLFISPGCKVYEGMIIGEYNKGGDLNVNPCKTKKLTNVRAASKDDNVQLTPVSPPTLEQAIDYINENELIEITPKSIRMRKNILNAQGRKYQK